MARVSPKQHRFSRGQISKKLHGSQDLELYYTALEVCRNYVVDGRGVLERRPGTRQRWRTKNDGAAVLVPFAYDPKQAYTLEMGASYLRAGFDGGLVLSGMTPFEIATPFTIEQLKTASYHQVGDVLWFATALNALQTINRVSPSAFTISPFALRDGPYLDVASGDTLLTPNGRGSLTPMMTTNTAPSGTVTASDGSAGAFRAFDGNFGSSAVIAGQSGFIQYDLPAGSAVVNAYYLVSEGDNYMYMPTAWTVDGWNGSSWITLDSRAGESDWAPGETRSYSFKNNNNYTKYRLRWTAAGTASNTVIAEIGFNNSSSGGFDIVASMISEINGGVGFIASDVGRSLRLLGSDNLWRWFLIDTVNSSSSITGRLQGPPLVDLSAITSWRLGAFWANNYPAVVTFHENRLTLSSRNRVYLSQPDDYSNFSPTETDGRVLPDSAITVVIPSYNSKRGAVSDIEVMKSTDFQLFVGTASGNFTIQSNSFGDGLTPDNATCRPQDGRGAGRMEAEVIGSSIIYAHNTRSKLMGSYEKGSGKFGAQDLSLPADDLVERGIVWTAYQESPHGVLWVGLNDGTLAGFTVQPEEKVQAWHEHPLGGRYIENGRRLPAQVESGCVIPGGLGARDDLYLVVKRTIGGQVRRFVESLEPYWTVGRDTKSAFFVDGGRQYDGNDDTNALITVSAGGPLDVRTITTASCPPFIAGTILAIFDGARWHRGRILTVDGSNNLTWRPVAPNAYAAPPDGARWHYIDGAWVQLADGVQFDVFALTYVDLAQKTNIWKWSVGLTTLTGLSDYEGAKLDLLVDGFPIMGRMVTGGQIADIPEGTVIAAGFHEPTKGKLLSIEAGSQNGSAQDKQRPVYEAVVGVMESATDLESGTGLPSPYGGVWEYYAPVTFDGVSNAMVEGEPAPLHSGYLRSTRDENGDINNPSVAWRQPTPLPSFVQGLITRLNESDGK